MMMYFRYLIFIAIIILPRSELFSSDFVESQILVHKLNNPAPGYLLLAPMTGEDLAAFDNAGHRVKLATRLKIYLLL